MLCLTALKGCCQHSDHFSCFLFILLFAGMPQVLKTVLLAKRFSLLLSLRECLG